MTADGDLLTHTRTKQGRWHFLSLIPQVLGHSNSCWFLSFNFILQHPGLKLALNHFLRTRKQQASAPIDHCSYHIKPRLPTSNCMDLWVLACVTLLGSLQLLNNWATGDELRWQMYSLNVTSWRLTSFSQTRVIKIYTSETNWGLFFNVL